MMADAALDPVRDVARPTPEGRADLPPPRILALTGGGRVAIQTLLRRAATAFADAGCRVLGVVEEIEGDGDTVLLRDLASGAVHPLTQDLGPGAGGCSLDSAGLAAACAGVEAAIAAALAAEGAAPSTLVILSKFGRQEAEGRGLTHAFHAAVAADLPILTSVSPTVSAAWATFSGELAAYAPLDLEVVRAWRLALHPGPEAGP